MDGGLPGSGTLAFPGPRAKRSPGAIAAVSAGWRRPALHGFAAAAGTGERRRPAAGEGRAAWSAAGSSSTRGGLAATATPSTVGLPEC
ncbi:MAG TPA: hypothetical protein VMT17_00390 [Anaeromyxobacteraceae bacterium]|nr:hypothetical protein [Anaeromyxobacteraceae bacterium]